MLPQKRRKLGFELVDELVDRLAAENDLDTNARDRLLQDARQAILSGKLKSRSPLTSLRIPDLAEVTPYVTTADFNAWLEDVDSTLVRLSTLRRNPRPSAELRSQWEGRTAKDFIEEKRRYGSFTAAAAAHNVSRQAYTYVYNRAVGKPSQATEKDHPQGVALWSPGVAAVKKKRTNSKS